MLRIKKFFCWLWGSVIMVLFLTLLGTHVYYKYFQAPELSYMIRNYIVFSGVNTNKAHVALFVNNEPVEKLYMTTIKIENTGGTVLERNDFSAEIDPLRITGENIKSVFIDANNSKFSSDTQIVEKNEEFLVNFNWLNPGDIITINTLRDNIKSNLTLKGRFAKIEAAKEVSFKDLKKKQALTQSLFLLVLVPVIATLITTLFFIVRNKIYYGVFWLSFKQFAACVYVSVYYKKDKKKRKRVLKEVTSTKDDKKLQKILDKYCG